MYILGAFIDFMYLVAWAGILLAARGAIALIFDVWRIGRFVWRWARPRYSHCFGHWIERQGNRIMSIGRRVASLESHPND